MELTQELTTLLTELRGKSTELKASYEQLQAEIKRLGNGEQTTKATVDELLVKDQKLRDDLNALTMRVESSAGTDGRKSEKKTHGQIFTESEQYKNLLKMGGVRSGRVNVKTFFGQEHKDITGASDSAGVGIRQADRLPIFTDPKLELRVRDLIPTTRTQATSIEFVRYTFTNNAAPIYTSSPSPRWENVQKPESDMTFTLDSERVQTIAHWVAASKQILQDVDNLEETINTELRYGLKLVEEEQLLFGDGTGGNLNGIATQATAYNAALNQAGDTRIDKIRHAIMQARLAQYPVDAIVLSVEDWHSIELTKDAEERYIIGDPRGMIGPTLWGRRVVESDSIDAGDFLVGAFRLGARIYDKEEATIETSDSHEDFFTKNMIAIRAEERLALVVTRPQAFVFGNGAL